MTRFALTFAAALFLGPVAAGGFALSASLMSWGIRGLIHETRTARRMAALRHI